MKGADSLSEGVRAECLSTEGLKTEILREEPLRDFGRLVDRIDVVSKRTDDDVVIPRRLGATCPTVHQEELTGAGQLHALGVPALRAYVDAQDLERLSMLYEHRHAAVADGAHELDLPLVEDVETGSNDLVQTSPETLVGGLSRLSFGHSQRSRDGSRRDPC